MPQVRSTTTPCTPGSIASESGIYRVMHDGHRRDHYVTIIQGDEFPHCRVCRAKVRYQLASRANYAAHDWDFAGPRPELLKHRPPKK